MKTNKKSRTSKKINKVNTNPSEKSRLSLFATGQETEINISTITVKESTASRNINDPLKYSLYQLPPFH
jgi:hypothetical protein